MIDKLPIEIIDLLLVNHCKYIIDPIDFHNLKYINVFFKEHIHKYKQLSRDLLESKLEEKSIEIKYKLERNLSMLGVVSTISPLLGLLGTVVGMITVFSTFQSSGAASPDLLASGISQALITTAFGLMIAVPGLILHRHFEQKVNKLMILLQSKTSSFIDNF